MNKRNRLIIPPIFLGTERNKEYANIKYHSGLIWIGVFKGSAGKKFSLAIEKWWSKKNNNIYIYIKIKIKKETISLKRNELLK